MHTEGSSGGDDCAADIEAAEMARLLLGVWLGIRVLARSQPKRHMLEGVAPTCACPAQNHHVPTRRGK